MSASGVQVQDSSRISSPVQVDNADSSEMMLSYPDTPPDLSVSSPPRASLALSRKSTPRPELKLITVAAVPTAPNSPRSQSPPSPFSSSSSSTLTPSTSASSLDSPIYPTSRSFRIPLGNTRAAFHSSEPIRPPPPPLAYPIISKAPLIASPLQLDPTYAFPPSAAGPSAKPSRNRSHTPDASNFSQSSSASRSIESHPYARPQTRDDATNVNSTKRRKMWNHALEKSIFTPHELSNMSAPKRRIVYVATLENHVEQLHQQLSELGLHPIGREELERYTGLNSKTAKSMVSGLQKDFSDLQLKKLELERANQTMRATLMDHGVAVNIPGFMTLSNAAARRHSIDSIPGSQLHNYSNYFSSK